MGEGEARRDDDKARRREQVTSWCSGQKKTHVLHTRLPGTVAPSVTLYVSLFHSYLPLHAIDLLGATSVTLRIEAAQNVRFTWSYTHLKTDSLVGRDLRP